MDSNHILYPSIRTKLDYSAQLHNMHFVWFPMHSIKIHQQNKTRIDSTLITCMWHELTNNTWDKGVQVSYVFLVERRIYESTLCGPIHGPARPHLFVCSFRQTSLVNNHWRHDFSRLPWCRPEQSHVRHQRGSAGMGASNPLERELSYMTC